MRVLIQRLGFLGIVIASLVVLRAGSSTVETLSPAEAAARVERGEAILVDVREPAEWAQTGVVSSAFTLPLSDLRGDRRAWAAFLETHRDQALILYCRSGNRSGQAAEILAAEGFRVANAGGLRDWTAAGQPTRRADAPRADAPTPEREKTTPQP